MTNDYTVTVTDPDGNPVFTGKTPGFTLVYSFGEARARRIVFDQPVADQTTGRPSSDECSPPTIKWGVSGRLNPNRDIVDCLWRNERH